MAEHATLSPSGAHRWLVCPPSARLENDLEECSSEFAKQGTDAHELAAFKVLRILGQDAEDPRKHLKYLDEEMEKATDEYEQLVFEVFSEMSKGNKQVLVFVEQRLDLSSFIPESFGTGDCFLASEEELVGLDFKYGVGVKVEAKENSQLMIYALGALELIGMLFNIKNVRMFIIQPRLDNIGQYELSTTELLNWSEEVLKPKALLAFKGEGSFCCGEHCRFCKAKNTCRERAAVGLEMAQREFSATLTDYEIESLLPKLETLISWAEDLKVYALDEALKGKKWNGFKVVQGRSVRKFTDEKRVIEAITSIGKDPYEKKLKSLTAIEKLLGKEKFNDLLGGLVSKTQGKPTLVPTSDKRDEYCPVESEFMSM